MKAFSVLVSILVVTMISSFAWGYGPNVILSDGIVLWDLPVIIDVETDLLKECTVPPADKDVSGVVDGGGGAVSIWQGVAETGLTTTVRSLGVDVDETNVCDFLFEPTICPANGSNILGPLEGGSNPIVFDEDGAITAKFFTLGNRYTVLGFAGIVLTDDVTLEAIKGEMVVNLGCLSDCDKPVACPSSMDNIDVGSVKEFVTHELGHFFGLNHTQVIQDFADQTHSPTMYAVFDPLSAADLTTLERDDEVGIAFLYPAVGSPLDSDFCAVTGTIRDENGDEFQCANVIARNMAAGQEDIDAISFVSGGDMPGGSFEVGHGRFTIQGLTPGNTYQIEIVPIDITYPLNETPSGIIPCNGDKNPIAPDFDEQTLSQTVTCQSSGSSLVVYASPQTLSGLAGDTIDVGDITVTGASENVADDPPLPSPGSTGGCSLIGGSRRPLRSAKPPDRSQSSRHLGHQRR